MAIYILATILLGDYEKHKALEERQFSPQPLVYMPKFSHSSSSTNLGY